MARIGKQGLDYYPQNVDFLQDRTIRRLVRKHGIVAIVTMLALKSYIYGEKGYYMKWDEDVCFDLSEVVNTDMEKVQAIIADTIHEGFFCGHQFKENGILTSEEIQKQYLASTLKRKNVVIREEYRLIAVPPQSSSLKKETMKSIEDTMTDSGLTASPETADCISSSQTTLWGEEIAISGEETHPNGGGTLQSKGKEIESKVEESKSKQTTPTPPGKSGNGSGASPQPGRPEEEGKILVNSRWVPAYCLNTRTHNYTGLLERLNQIHVTDMKDVNKIVAQSDYGKIGHPLWGIISYSNWPRGNTIKFPGKYILSQLKLLS